MLPTFRLSFSCSVSSLRKTGLTDRHVQRCASLTALGVSCSNHDDGEKKKKTFTGTEWGPCPQRILGCPGSALSLVHLEVWDRDLFPWSLGSLDGEALWAFSYLSAGCGGILLFPHQQPTPHHRLHRQRADHSVLPYRCPRPAVLSPLSTLTVPFPLIFLFCPSVPRKANGSGLERADQQNYSNGPEKAQGLGAAPGSMEGSGLCWH